MPYRPCHRAYDHRIRDPDDDNPAEPADPNTPTKRDFLLVSYRRKKAEAARLESRLARDEGRLISRALVGAKEERTALSVDLGVRSASEPGAGRGLAGFRLGMRAPS